MKSLVPPEAVLLRRIEEMMKTRMSERATNLHLETFTVAELRDMRKKSDTRKAIKDTASDRARLLHELSTSGVLPEGIPTRVEAQLLERAQCLAFTSHRTLLAVKALPYGDQGLRPLFVQAKTDLEARKAFRERARDLKALAKSNADDYAMQERVDVAQLDKPQEPQDYLKTIIEIDSVATVSSNLLFRAARRLDIARWQQVGPSLA